MGKGGGGLGGEGGGFDGAFILSCGRTIRLWYLLPLVFFRGGGEGGALKIKEVEILSTPPLHSFTKTDREL